MSEFRVVGFEPARRPEVLELMREVWGATPLEREWDWWFEASPAGEPIISLAESDGRVVGVACMSVYRLRIGGTERLAAVPLHVATHADFRGRGLFTALEEENERRAAERFDVALTFPNAASRTVFLRLGWRELPGLRVWARPRSRRELDGGIERVETFPEVPPAGCDGLARDAAYLTWRFAASPRDYTCLVSQEGAAVVGARAVGGRSVAFVAELVAPTGRPTRRLLRAALATAGTSPVLALPPGGRTGDLVRVGFVPTPRKIAVLVKSLKPATALPDRWCFSLGDGDSW